MGNMLYLGTTKIFIICYIFLYWMFFYIFLNSSFLNFLFYMIGYNLYYNLFLFLFLFLTFIGLKIDKKNVYISYVFIVIFNLMNVFDKPKEAFLDIDNIQKNIKHVDTEIKMSESVVTMARLKGEFIKNKYYKKIEKKK